MEYFYLSDIVPQKIFDVQKRSATPMQQFPHDTGKLIGVNKQIDFVQNGKYGIFFNLRLENVLSKFQDEKLNCYLLVCSKIVAKNQQLRFDRSWIRSVLKITVDDFYAYKIMENNVVFPLHELDFIDVKTQIENQEGLVTKRKLVHGYVIYYCKIFVLQKIKS